MLIDTEAIKRTLARKGPNCDDFKDALIQDLKHLVEVLLDEREQKPAPDEWKVSAWYTPLGGDGYISDWTEYVYSREEAESLWQDAQERIAGGEYEYVEFQEIFTTRKIELRKEEDS